ncbi:MAG: hypothetical protein BGO78_11040 [Chloroflexi bacterium 44-23]|nr:MAG: hypothetical protein BGO78_11040 [Chloroflexi bacterium 44-23]
MRKDDFPYLADWFAISLRWFSLLGITLALATTQNLVWYLSVVLIIIALWNVALSFLAMLNRRMSSHRLINLTIDCLAVSLLFSLSGGITGPISWGTVLAILSAAIYYEWRGSLIVAAVISLYQVGWTYLTRADFTMLWLPLVILLAYNLILAVILGFSSLQLMSGTRKNYYSQINKRREMEKRAQIQERNRIQSFYQLVETLSSTLNYRVVLDTILDLSQSALTDSGNKSESMPSAVFLFDDEKLVIANARGFSPADMKGSFPANAGILYSTLTTGEAQTTNEINSDPELGRISAFINCTSAVCLPLARGLDSYGAIIFGHSDPTFFTPERLELLQMISRQAIIAIQNARLYQQLQSENEHILETQEEARNKLARDLHDGPTQSVSAIAMRLEIVRKMLFQSPAEVEPELRKIEELARRTTNEIRHMLFTMRPLVLESDGLDAALHAIADKTFVTYKQKVKVETDPNVIRQLDSSKQTVVFYLADEAINNARKHANARLIWVRLRVSSQDPEIALLEILDNGSGFDMDQVSSDYSHRGSLGMVNLQERAQLINGLLHIDSLPGRGTRVQVFIPLSNEAGERIQHGVIDLRNS